MVKTRMDAVVRIRERSEEEAERHLAQATVSLGHARGELDAARDRAAQDRRAAGQAAHWELADAAHARALAAVRSAKEAVVAAGRREEDARAGFAAAYQEAEAARRVAERKREEIVRERERAERKAVDELATLRFNHRG